MSIEICPIDVLLEGGVGVTPGVLPAVSGAFVVAGAAGAAAPFAFDASEEPSPPHAASSRAESEAARAARDVMRVVVMCVVSLLEKGWWSVCGGSAVGRAGAGTAVFSRVSFLVSRIDSIRFGPARLVSKRRRHRGIGTGCADAASIGKAEACRDVGAGVFFICSVLRMTCGT
ncbi:hypothetical protein [Burkholderia savannae]|uniref:hypothetical protein n=1 Tax=Burkholderia savannae TaxID=1637837 RepID=UPI001E4DE87B|nr:hypothetical protein [Burkholderia savannae]